VYSLVKLQNAHCSRTRIDPSLEVVAASITDSVDDLVRLKHCGHLSYVLAHFA
jgi:hypothetical protein